MKWQKGEITRNASSVGVIVVLVFVWKFTRLNINEAPGTIESNTQPDYIARVNGIFSRISSET